VHAGAPAGRRAGGLEAKRRGRKAGRREGGKVGREQLARHCIDWHYSYAGADAPSGIGRFIERHHPREEQE
jgi:hypothetical protein